MTELDEELREFLAFQKREAEHGYTLRSLATKIAANELSTRDAIAQLSGELYGVAARVTRIESHHRDLKVRTEETGRTLMASVTNELQEEKDARRWIIRQTVIVVAGLVMAIVLAGGGYIFARLLGK